MLLSTIVDTGIITFQQNNNNSNSHAYINHTNSNNINNNSHGLSSLSLSSSQPDLYHVAEVLHLCLKNLKFPLFHEIYSNAMIDGNEMRIVYV
jgi:hypothetical protein